MITIDTIPFIDDKIIITMEDLIAKQIALGDNVEFDNIDTELYVFKSKDIKLSKKLKQKFKERDAILNNEIKKEELYKKLGVTKENMKLLKE
jgi:hypothetical protein